MSIDDTNGLGANNFESDNPGTVGGARGATVGATGQKPLSDEEKLAKVELVRDKTGVSYADARSALEQADYDVLDAVIWLEEHGKTPRQSARYATSSATAEPEPEMVEAQIIYERDTRRSRIEDKINAFFTWLQGVMRKSLEIKLAVYRHGVRRFTIPLLVVILLLLAFWITLPLLVISLFFGFSYRFEGISKVTVDLNDLSQKASDGADYLKRTAKDLHDEYDTHSKKSGR